MTPPPEYRLFITIGNQRVDITDEIEAPIYSFGFIKPHAFGRRDEILDYIERFSAKESTPIYVLQGKEEQLTRAVAEEHYKALKDMPFFVELVNMVTEAPTYHFIVTSTDADINRAQGGTIRTFRNIVGATDPKKARSGTIRERFGDKRRSMMYNAIHACDGLPSLVEETELHFSRDELGIEFWQRIDAYKQWLDHFRE